MGRKPRVHFPGACYHVVVRGNNRQRIFRSDGDRNGFLALVAEGVERFDYLVHAYCLMTNHVHFAIQVAGVPLSKIAHNLTFRFARQMHKRLGCSGHFFERRYRAGLVETDRSLLNVVRYIHRNPVEAGLANTPGSYQWSSHRGYVEGCAPSWLTTGLVLRLCARDEQRAIIELARLVGEKAPFDEVLGDPERPLVDVELAPRFRRQMDVKLDCSVQDVLAVAARAAGIGLRDLQGPSRRRPVARARALAALIVRDHSNLSLRELAERLNRSPSTMSCLASRAELVAPNDRLREELMRLLDTK
jgi:REP element-mobilizing transposase RayT